MSGTSVLFAGLGAGVTEAIFAVTPTETIKTKLIHDRNTSSPKYNGLVHGVRTIVKVEGWRGLYQGVVPTVLRQGANSAIRFTVYGQMQAFWKRQLQPQQQATSVSAAKSFLSGAVAGTASTYLTMPIDVVKTRLQGHDSKAYRGAWHCLTRIVKDEGVKMLWKGASLMSFE